MSERNCVMHGALEVSWYTEDVPDLDGEPRCYVCELEKRAEAAERLNKDPYTIDATHTDPVQKETALCLKYRQRARDAEAASKVDSECNVIMQKALGAISCQKISEYDSCQPVAAGSLAMANKALEDCKAITDKFMEDVLMPDKGGDK